MNACEHLAWCKTRALDELNYDHSSDGARNAIASLLSDLRKHPETKDNDELPALMMMLFSDVHEVRRYIEELPW